MATSDIWGQDCPVISAMRMARDTVRRELLENRLIRSVPSDCGPHRPPPSRAAERPGSTTPQQPPAPAGAGATAGSDGGRRARIGSTPLHATPLRAIPLRAIPLRAIPLRPDPSALDPSARDPSAHGPSAHDVARLAAPRRPVPHERGPLSGLTLPAPPTSHQRAPPQRRCCAAPRRTTMITSTIRASPLAAVAAASRPPRPAPDGLRRCRRAGRRRRPGPPQPGGTLRFAVGSDQGCVDPQQVTSNDSIYSLRQIVDSLTDQDPDTGEIEPWLATTWQTNADATSYTFTLREGVTFSDGTPLDADAVQGQLRQGAAARRARHPAEGLPGELPGHHRRPARRTFTVSFSRAQRAVPAGHLDVQPRDPLARHGRREPTTSAARGWSGRVRSCSRATP